MASHLPLICHGPTRRRGNPE